GRPQRRIFINVATAGLGGKVARSANAANKLLWPGLTYFLYSAGHFLTANPQRVSINIDKKDVYEGQVLNVFIANGAYSGGGMKWSNRASVTDGIAEVLAVEPVSKAQLPILARKLYDGGFENLPNVQRFRGKEIHIESQEEVLIEMDGEQPGRVPLACEVLPKVIQLATGKL
ncbi:MAG: hypothetical protein IT289_05415, partial [Oligoflexia bacterium]|nr:hypothetical protein [Oligoflexia bacterium]